ncbi:MAG: ubiquinone biosynthesis regulatory protein kinase UbiB [Methylophilaceae bacterium]|nr:ubiquinone biosynthesis regulatory protein kinase UbiB [Methylophilaceae bacterium]
MIIFRIIFIIFIVLKFRLDEFFKLRKNSLLSILLYPLSLIKSKKDNRAIRLRLALESLGPIFIKFGQMLSTRKDLLPNDIAIELSKLQDKVPPFEFKKVKQTIENAYSKKISSVFKEFNEKPVASASVAQVHFAILHNGEKVAVKILRPNIESEVKKDIKLLHLIANILYKIWSDGKRLKPDEVVSEFERHTQSELNLLLEAGHCSHLGENFKDKKLLVVPSVFWDYCHEKVMVMERMDGIPISNIDAIKKNKINLSELAKNGVEIFFTQVFRDGFFHADMHPGNIQVAKSGKYIAMDFGIMGTLNDQDKLYLAKNFAAFFKRDYREVARVHIESGWVPAETSIDEFENAIRSVCEPIFNKPLKDISFGKLLIRLFQTSKKFNMEIQPQLTMLQKTLLNVEGLGRELDPNLDLWVTARPFLENWLKGQIGPKNLINRIKKEFPNWVDIAPQLPTLLHAYLNNHNKDSYTIIEKDIRKSIEGIKLRQDRIILVMIILFMVITFAVLTFI